MEKLLHGIPLSLRFLKKKKMWVYLPAFSVILYSQFLSGMAISVSQEKMGDRFLTLDAGYGWIYNPKELSVWNLVFED